MLLSRVADSLYWISRYLERAEHTARVVDVDVDLDLDGYQAPRTLALGCTRASGSAADDSDSPIV